MFRKCFLLNVLFISIVHFSFNQLYAQEKEEETNTTSERSNKEIDKEKKVSVGAHLMVEEVDAGLVLVEEFAETNGKTPAEVYNDLYPLYALVTMKVLEKVKNQKQSKK